MSNQAITPEAVSEALQQAIANGYDMPGMEDADIAMDLASNNSDFEGLEALELMPHIARWRVLYHGERYKGVNISWMELSLKGTPFESNAELLKEMIDSISLDGAVIDTYKAWEDYQKPEGLEEDDEDVQSDLSDLRLEFEVAVMDVIKKNLGIPADDSESIHDTHTICYDAANEYDAKELEHLDAGSND